MNLLNVLNLLNLHKASKFIKTFIMNKLQLADAVAKKANISKIEAKKALEAFIEITTEVVKSDERLALIGFGSFVLSKRKSRIGRNPQTGETILIPAKKTVQFKAGSDLTASIQ